MSRVPLSGLEVLGYSAQIYQAEEPETADIRYLSPTGHSWWEELIELSTAQYMATIAMVKAALLVTPMIAWVMATDPEPKGDQVCWILNSRAAALVLAGEELPPATNFLFLVDGGRIDYTTPAHKFCFFLGQDGCAQTKCNPRLCPDAVYLWA